MSTSTTVALELAWAWCAGRPDLARSAGCYGTWVGTEDANVAAVATYPLWGDPR